MYCKYSKYTVNSQHNSVRVIAYVDGFNLYFGMKENGNNTLWLNIQMLVNSLLKLNQHLLNVKYFTSRIRNNPNKEARQKKYLEALNSLTDFSVIYGQYQAQTETCRQCGHAYQYANEKMTDVNMAVALLEDAHYNLYDMAFLITGDSDLVPSINAIHKMYPNKRVFVAFPPNRSNSSVKKAAKGNMVIGRKKLIDAQFPDIVTTGGGYDLIRPKSWV